MAASKNNYIITGSIAVGKSTVVNKIREKGFEVIDSDKIVSDLYEVGNVGYELIKEKVGEEYVNEKTVNRDLIRKNMEKDISILRAIEKIIHPLVVEKINEQLTKEINFIDIPLYYENKDMFKFPHKVIVVWTTREKELERLMNRNGIDEEAAMRLIDLQIDIDNKKADADFVIDNSGVAEDLDFEVEALFKSLKIKR